MIGNGILPSESGYGNTKTGSAIQYMKRGGSGFSKKKQYLNIDSGDVLSQGFIITKNWQIIYVVFTCKVQ